MILMIIGIVIPVEAVLKKKLHVKSNFREGYDPYLQSHLMPGDKKLHINKEGFRGEELEKEKEDKEIRVFILGGSSVLCSRVPYENSHARILEKELQKLFPEKKIIIQNAGNHWHTTRHSIEKYLFKVRDYKPDLVIMWHGINDLYRSFVPEAYAFGKYKRDYSHFYGATSKMATGYSLTDRLRVQAEPITGIWTFDLLAGMVRDHLFTDFFPKEIFPPVEVESFKSLNAFRENIEIFINILLTDNVPLVLATQAHSYKNDIEENFKKHLFVAKSFCNEGKGVPSMASMVKGMNTFNASVKEIALKRSVYFCDTDSKVPKTSSYFIDDVHYTVKGNKRVAEIFKEFILNNEDLFSLFH